MEIRPFAIDVAAETLADLRNRLAATRWPAALDDPKSQLGIENATVRHWCERWRDFDWGKRQAELNAFDQFIARIDGIDLHFIHVRSASPGATPLLLMNGWPSTFAELTKLIEPLTSGDPAFRIDEQGLQSARDPHVAGRWKASPRRSCGDSRSANAQLAVCQGSGNRRTLDGEDIICLIRSPEGLGVEKYERGQCQVRANGSLPQVGSRLPDM